MSKSDDSETVIMHSKQDSLKRHTCIYVERKFVPLNSG